MMNLAQINLYDPSKGSLVGLGPLGLEQGQDGVTVFAKFISTSIGLITVIAIIWFVFVFISGTLSIITSAGDKGSNEAAKKRISSGIIGLVVTLLGILIIRLIGMIFGLDLLNFGAMITALTI